MEYILQLEKMDDLPSIRGRIEMVLSQMEAPLPVYEEAEKTRRRLLLVVPRQNKALQSLVNIKLLNRVGNSKFLELGLVTNHSIIRDYASQVGLKTFGSVRAAKRFRWISADAPMAMPGQTLPPVFVPDYGASDSASMVDDAERLAQKSTQTKRYRVIMGSGRVGCLQQLIALFLAGFLASGVVMAVILLLPQATITLTPVAQDITADLVVRGDPQADTVNFSELTFPARVAQVELSLVGNIETIEAEFAPSGYASGNITLINKTNLIQHIPLSTTLTTSSGEKVEFTTLITAELPAQIDGTTLVPVRATEPGPIGNVGMGQISRFVDPQYGVVARALNEFGLGGGVLELTHIVVNDDKERLQIHLIEEMRKEGLKRLQDTLGEQEFISPDTIQVIPLALTFREFSGDFSETFSGEMQAVVRGTVVGGYNANRLALAALEAQVPLGFKLDAKGLHFGAGEVLEAEKGVVRFRIVASGIAVPELDKHEIAKKVAWLSVGEAQEHLNQAYDLATVPGIELEPKWLTEQLGRLPYNSVRVNVVVKDAVTLLTEEEQEN
ncbi:baseplate J/gp47 family protein [Anaerolineales bacterium HSG24]|nr:baseplate J/gp47 family protein [Anaerolineales bacterium HSG24]